MLNVIELDFDYQDQPLLNKVNFNLPVGGLLHLRGANGSGKTTLLKLISGLYQPINGHIEFKGQPVKNNLAAYQRQLCLVGHKTGINPYLSLKENCSFDSHYDVSHDVVELASIFKLEHQLNSLCGILSAGQKRQAGLLRLWMTKAKLWLLDEPLVALDDDALTLVMAKIEQHRAKGGAVLLTSHQDLPLNSSSYQEYFL